MSQKKFIVGNWKMNPSTSKQAEGIFKALEKTVSTSKQVQPIICPPFVFFDTLSKLKSKKIMLGAQNLFYEPKGSYTGEISADMLKDKNIYYVIIGHSERRKLGETNEVVNKKIHAALKAGLIPIMCIGEENRDEEGHYIGFIKEQIEQGLLDVSKRQLASVIIAYEPIYAIGAAEALHARDVHEMTILIKKILVDLYKIKTIPVPILYGGSVDPLNARELLQEGEADGFLIGRQSLESQSFLKILEIAHEV